MRNTIQMMCVAAITAALGSAAMAVDIETVHVGNSGNAADTRYSASGYGAVSYEYNIGTYEVTAGQYTEFLNAVAATDSHGLYSGEMRGRMHSACKIVQSGSPGSYTYTVPADRANRPVNYVDVWDACRFANWLHNGQGSGDTESGAYTLTADGIANNTVTRNADWKWAVTSEDEWYKAAYHKDDGVTGNYYTRPTSSDATPSNDLVEPTDPGNNATFYDGPLTPPHVDSGFTITQPSQCTEFGAHENSDSPYGTFDQGGNVWEWNEAIIGSGRGARGGSFYDGGYTMHASSRNNFATTYERTLLGFRVSVVPEPATMAMLALGGAALLRRRKRVQR